MSSDLVSSEAAAERTSGEAQAQSRTELEVLVTVGNALAPLPPDAARRVLGYFNDMYGLSRNLERAEPFGAVPRREQVRREQLFHDFAEMFDAANPQNGLDRVLLAAYWYQVVQEREDFDSQTINSELKNLGHPSSNITRDLDQLMARTPRPVMQVRKSGSAQQARKRYKLTREGVRAVEVMVSRGRNE